VSLLGWKGVSCVGHIFQRDLAANLLSDGNIRYFELENDKFEYLSEYKSGDPQRGLAFMPKRGVNMHQNEVVRIFKSVGDTHIEPISFIVPRRSEVFQDDIYPPTTGLKPAMGSSEWFDGKEAIPPKISMASLYEGTGLQEVTPTQDKPTPTMSAPAPKAAEPAKAPEPAPAPEPTPVARPPPSMKEQGASMASMVTKFADEVDNEDEADDSSSFEEVVKPTERIPVASSPTKVQSPIESASKAAEPKVSASISKVHPFSVLQEIPSSDKS
jgi:coronin-1B/1C/6